MSTDRIIPDLIMSIVPLGDGFNFSYYFPSGEIADNWYPLPFNREDLANQMRKVYDLLEKIILTNDVYTDGLHIPRDVCDAHLYEIAELGLFKFFFLGRQSKPPEGADEFVRELRELSKRKGMLNIRINAMNNRFVFPWHLLYEKDHAYKEKVDQNFIWGFRHNITEPLTLGAKQKRLNSSNLKFSFYFDNELDKISPCVSKQRSFFKKNINNNDLQPPNYRECQYTSDLVKALAQPTPEELIYFYCHVIFITKSLDESYIRLSQPQFPNIQSERKITLGQLYEFAGPDIILKERPLVFLNACDSVSMQNILYEGFLPYFQRKGVCGIIGTMSKVPVIFASLFALNFFKNFMSGDCVDSVIRILRKKFMDDYNNIMGLYYISTCSLNLRLDSPIPLKLDLKVLIESNLERDK